MQHEVSAHVGVDINQRIFNGTKDSFCHEAAEVDCASITRYG